MEIGNYVEPIGPYNLHDSTVFYINHVLSDFGIFKNKPYATFLAYILNSTNSNVFAIKYLESSTPYNEYISNYNYSSINSIFGYMNQSNIRDQLINIINKNNYLKVKKGPQSLITNITTGTVTTQSVTFYYRLSYGDFTGVSSYPYKYNSYKQIDGGSRNSILYNNLLRFDFNGEGVYIPINGFLPASSISNNRFLTMVYYRNAYTLSSESSSYFTYNPTIRELNINEKYNMLLMFKIYIITT